MKLTTHLQVVAMSRIRRSKHPLPPYVFMAQSSAAQCLLSTRITLPLHVLSFSMGIPRILAILRQPSPQCVQKHELLVSFKMRLILVLWYLFIWYFLYFSISIFPNAPRLWSCGQSSWLQIQRSGFNSRRYFLRSSGSGTGSLSLVSTIKELLDRKVAAPV
jgi:hypothetical protein